MTTRRACAHAAGLIARLGVDARRRAGRLGLAGVAAARASVAARASTRSSPWRRRTRRRAASSNVEDLGRREAAVQAHAQPRAGNAARSLGSRRTQQPARARLPPAPCPGRRIAATRYWLRLVVEGQERDERQIAPAAVEAIEEGELLRAVGRIFGQVEIDRDPAHAAPPPPMLRDHGVGQCLAQPEQRAWRDRVLEPRQRRLRRQARAVDRVAVEQQLVDRILGQRVRVVGVGIAARQPEDALREQVVHRVPHAARRRAPSPDDGGQPLDQLRPPLGRFQQDRAAVRTRVGLIERRDEGLARTRSGKRTVCAIVGSFNATPPCGEKVLQQGLSTTRRRFCFYAITSARDIIRAKREDPWNRDAGEWDVAQVLRPVQRGRQTTLRRCAESPTEASTGARAGQCGPGRGQGQCRLAQGSRAAIACRPGRRCGTAPPRSASS